MNKTLQAQNTVNDSKAIAEKRWNKIVLHWVFLLSALLLLTVTSAEADMVFDFQKKMADKGNTEAQFKVGEMYQTGRGVKQDNDAAIEWFKKASAQGHSEATYKLLYLSIQKDGMTSENKTAANALSKKAKAGDGVSQYYLGLMYHHGVGLKRNSDKALDWYKKAALKGMTAAEQGIREIQTAKGEWAAKEAKRKAAEKKRAALAAKKKAEQEAKAKAEREAANAARKKQSQDKQAAQQAALAAERERKRQELIKARQQRAAQPAKQAVAEEKPEFEADPCSGKSARFLSTCR